eukprot:scaffold1484_cov241-Pinguiococcus_pyrenoidosus.AAC.19
MPGPATARTGEKLRIDGGGASVKSCAEPIATAWPPCSHKTRSGTNPASRGTVTHLSTPPRGVAGKLAFPK